jgi:acetylornithine/succinyldiaminopimelate/putrescine aminotransferase
VSVRVHEHNLLPVYPRADVTFVEGDGVWLTDADGKRYLDFAAGIAVVGLGHRHPAVTAAAHVQLDRLWHASNLYNSAPGEQLAGALAERWPGSQAFFCNSGAEANEAAIKYAYRATGKRKIVALEGSFHGRTLGALAVTGQPAKRAAFAPLLADVVFVDAGDTSQFDDAGLILIEPIQGEGGVHPVDSEFILAAAESEALLCLDEIQTGMGRTGSFFAFEQLGVEPDLVTLAKGLANGLPIGALLVGEQAAGAFAVGDHGSTFGGNPVTCAAAVAVCAELTDVLFASVRDLGAKLLAADLPHVVEARGRGLLVGYELDIEAQPVVDAALEHGLVTLTAGKNVLRLAPPLIVTEQHVDDALGILEEVLS